MGTGKVHVISVDMGTSSVRACLIDNTLSILHKSQYSVSLSTDMKGKAEQSPQEIITNTIRSINDVLLWAGSSGIGVSAISFSNAVSSLVPLDKYHDPVGPAFTYADTRAHEQARHVKETHGSAQFQYSACPMHASYWLPKFLWLREVHPELFNSTYFCTLKDLLIYQISGKFITDQSNTAATGMSDVRTKDWDDTLLAFAGITREQLPAVQSTLYQTTTIEGGLPAGLTIVLGATDGVLSSLGAGAFKPGQVTTMIGSSGACRIAADTPLVDDAENTIWSYPLDEEIWIRGGAMNSGGLVTDWAASQFYGGIQPDPEERLDHMNADAEKIEAGADGLLFLPYLYGERSPIWNENARGTFFGLHSSHQRGHLSRAVLEGILFALYSIFEIITAGTRDNVEIRATGGYLRSPLMLQTQADIFGHPVGIPGNLEGSSIGAAVLALRSISAVDAYADLAQYLPIVRQFAPNTADHNVYQEKFQQFKRLYAQLQPLMVPWEDAK